MWTFHLSSLYRSLFQNRSLEARTGPGGLCLLQAPSFSRRRLYFSRRSRSKANLTAKCTTRVYFVAPTSRCKLKFNIDRMNELKFFECVFRPIKFPARSFEFFGNPRQLHSHSVACQFNMINCAVTSPGGTGGTFPPKPRKNFQMNG